ncbi:MAG: hypothetical protein J6N78_07105, partial [Clostridia bacterium]|nr:hypothetical protein [Clostridia bacterium]
ISSAKEDCILTATTAKTDALNATYVSNNANKTIAQSVIDALLAKNNTNVGSATIEVANDGTVTISTTGYEVIGTVDENGTLTFGDLETTLPGIKLSKETLPIEPGQTGTLTVTFKKIPDTTPVTWTSSDTTNKITVSNGTVSVNSDVGNVTEATITAKVTYNGTDYTKTCLVTVAQLPKVGDFVTYDAGTWIADETDGKIKLSVKDENGVPSKIDANTSTNLPSSNWQFGGFAAGSSKNGNATPFTSSYNYVKDSSRNAVTGWRIFDIADDGITLISAGCPEDYYHPCGTNYGYISEYILTGEDNSPSNVTLTGLGSTYKARDWTADYGDSSRNITASVLTKSKLEDWYKKYVDSGTTNLYFNATNYGSTTGQTIFQKIYKKTTNAINSGKYESLIDNYSTYWLASARSDYPYDVYDVESYYRNMRNSSQFALGVRVLVSLPSSISLKETPSGTKELVDPRDANNTYTYNVWDIK